jgi:hypothetical protein
MELLTDVLRYAFFTSQEHARCRAPQIAGGQGIWIERVFHGVVPSVEESVAANLRLSHRSAHAPASSHSGQKGSNSSHRAAVQMKRAIMCFSFVVCTNRSGARTNRNRLVDRHMPTLLRNSR